MSRHSRGQVPFERGARLMASARPARPAPVRRRKGVPIELAVRRSRRFRQEDEAGRNHVRRQLAARQRAQVLLARRRARAVDDVGDEALVVRRTFHRAHDGVLHAFVVREHFFDLAGLDPEAVDLHLPVDPAEDLDAAVGPPPRFVSSAVDAAGRQRMGDEALGGQRRAMQVAASHPGAADAHLADGAHRYRLPRRVENVQIGVANRIADHDRSARFHFPLRGPHGGLGRAIDVPHRRSRPQQIVGQLSRQRLAAAEHGHAVTVAPAGAAEQAEERGRSSDEGDPVRGDHVREGAGIAVLRCGCQHDSGAGRQRQQQLDDRNVERERDVRENTIGVRQAGRGRERRDQVGERRVRDLDALWCARRPRRVEHVGRALGVHVNPRRVGGLAAERRIEVDAHAADAGRDQGRQRRPGQHQRRPAVVQHVGEPFGGEVGIERNVRRAGLEDPQQRHEHVGAAVHQQRHEHAGPDAGVHQRPGNRIAATVELAVGEFDLALDQRRLICEKPDHFLEMVEECTHCRFHCRAQGHR